jgi:hypothetical protein
VIKSGWGHRLGQNFLGRQQAGLFQQPAEIFFAGNQFPAILGVEAGHGFVFHLEPLQAHDADVFLALFPDLALLQLHGRHYTNHLRALATRLLRKKGSEFPKIGQLWPVRSASQCPIVSPAGGLQRGR